MVTQVTLASLVEKYLEDSIQLNQLFHIRIDLDEDNGPTIECVNKFLISYDQYLCSDIEYKGDGTQHVHALLRAECTRKELREKIKSELTVKMTEFSTSYVRNLQQCTKYIVKEGYTKHKGIPLEFIKKCQKLSHKKTSKNDLSKFLIETRDKFICSDDISLKAIVADIIRYHKLHNIKPQLQSLRNDICLWMIQKDKYYESLMVDHLVEQVEKQFFVYSQK